MHDTKSKKKIEEFQRYFISIAKQLGDKNSKKYEKGFHQCVCEQIDFFDPSSALYGYLMKQNEYREYVGDLIFPFGINSSQLKAVEQTFQNQISVIQGPPGTGKTQTILTIIANAIMNNKTVAVVSPNNAATDNVFEKLEKEGLSLIAANLGKTKKAEAFFKNMLSIPKIINEWRIPEDELDSNKEKLTKDLISLSQILDERNRLATLEQELRDWQQEKKYFESYIKSRTDSNSGPPQDRTYDYFEHSILSSIEAVFGEELPSVLLKEHYRCHPMIINFCNQEFYDGELIVLSDFNEDEKALVLVETSDGNHMKFDYDKKIFNQREIDSVLSEEFSKACPIIHDMKTTGLVTPFRRQADKSLKVRDIYETESL